MEETYTLTQDMVLVLEAYDDDECFGCRLVRRFNEYLGEWVTAVSVFDVVSGKEMMHSGTSQCEMTRDSALEQIELAMLLFGKVG